MKIKLDENVHGDAQAALAGWGHDVATVVRAERRCLVTFDLDFADARRYPPLEYAGIRRDRRPPDRVPTSKMQVRRLLSCFASKPDLEGKLWIADELRARDWTS